MPARGFDIRPRLRLWRQRRRKRQIENKAIDYVREWAFQRQLFSRGVIDIIIPEKPCWQCEYGILELYKEQQYWRGFGVHYIPNLRDEAKVECRNCSLRADAMRMKEQEERMMQQEELIEPDTAKWRVRLRLLQGADDCDAESRPTDK